MAKGTGSREGAGRCSRLLASHQQPCGVSRKYSEDQLLKTGIRDRNGQFDGQRQKLTSKSPTGFLGRKCRLADPYMKALHCIVVTPKSHTVFHRRSSISDRA
ncbi:MAG: hypothetical protein FD162_2076 [Rhodobacteraceae bacterium]|nr:MAG: hypothetical protein FD162_2076 [Paracoccaceae bacterium]